MAYTTHTSLLVRLSEGVDPGAWKDFHDRYLELIKGFGRRYGLQSADCEDAAQEVLLALSKSMGDFAYDPSKGKFRSYLKTVSLRIILGILRQKRDRRALSDVDATEDSAFTDPAVEEMWEAEWREYHMRQAMRRIECEFNERDRLAFADYVVKDRSAEDTAKSLGMSVDQVYQAKSRIVRRLSQMIAEQVRNEG